MAYTNERPHAPKARRLAAAGMLAFTLHLPAACTDEVPPSAVSSSPTAAPTPPAERVIPLPSNCSERLVGKVILSQPQWRAVLEGTELTPRQYAVLTKERTVHPDVIRAARHEAAPIDSLTSDAHTPSTQEMMWVSRVIRRDFPPTPSEFSGWSPDPHPAIPQGSMEIKSTQFVCTQPFNGTPAAAGIVLPVKG